MANETLNIQNGVSPITIDTEVTEGSMRPVTSDGIYKAIQAGGGGGLPSVTTADKGKFLCVDENGEWQKDYLNNYSTRLGSPLEFTCVGNTLTYSGSFPPINDLFRAYSSHGAANAVVHYGGELYENIITNEWLLVGDEQRLGLYVPSSSKGAFIITIIYSDVVDRIYASYISANKYVEVTLTPTNLVSGTVDISNSGLVNAIENRYDIKINADAIIQGSLSDPTATGTLTPIFSNIIGGTGYLQCIFYMPSNENTYSIDISNGTYSLTVI